MKLRIVIVILILATILAACAPSTQPVVAVEPAKEILNNCLTQKTDNVRCEDSGDEFVNVGGSFSKSDASGIQTSLSNAHIGYIVWASAPNADKVSIYVPASRVDDAREIIRK